MNSSRQHLILWDGDCEFCRRCVRYAQKLDTRNQFEFSPYQNASSPPMTPQLRENCARAVHVLKRNGRILRGGRAVLFLLESCAPNPFLKRFYRLAASFPLILLVELGYQIVARNRTFFSRFF